MSTVTALPHSRPFSRDDLESMPDDGHRVRKDAEFLPVSCLPWFALSRTSLHPIRHQLLHDHSLARSRQLSTATSAVAPFLSADTWFQVRRARTSA